MEQIKAFVLPLGNVVHNFVSIKLQLGKEGRCTKDTNKTDRELNESICQSLLKKCAGHGWGTALAEQCEQSNRDMSQHNKELNFSENWTEKIKADATPCCMSHQKPHTTHYEG